MTLAIGILRRLAFASLAILLLSGCAREQPIYQIENQPIPQLTQPLSVKQIEARIIEAGNKEDWRIRPIGSGRLQGTTSWSRHSATVTIDYDSRGYSIRYKTSVLLLEGIAAKDHVYAGQRVIHKEYNRRVRALETAINNELSLPGS
jgi:hypothetical protein